MFSKDGGIKWNGLRTVNHPDFPYVCIVGAPRSGTTILGEKLAQQSEIAYLFEPYFLWDRHSGPMADDRRTADIVDAKTKYFIRREMHRYLKKRKARFLVDKSPFNSLRIPFVNAIFPEAKFIHIVRDGRAVALSTNKKWLERKDYTRNGHTSKFFSEVFDKLNKRRDWRLQLLAIWYELRHNLSFKLRDYYAAYYDGEPGWGVRYPDFEKDLREFTLFQFNALQWLSCVNQIESDFVDLSEDRKIVIRYEDFVRDPAGQYYRILKFIGVQTPGAVNFEDVAVQHQQAALLSKDDRAAIDQLIGWKLAALGYR